jgi:hypothetical protein
VNAIAEDKVKQMCLDQGYKLETDNARYIWLRDQLWEQILAKVQ